MKKNSNFSREILNILLKRTKVTDHSELISNTKLTKRHKIRVLGEHNRLFISDNFNIKSCNINIQGKNNIVILDENIKGNHLKIEVNGNNNTITIEKDIIIYGSLSISHNNFGDNCSLRIGKGTSFFVTDIHLYDTGSSISIGEDCMFSKNTTIYHSDGHAILENGNIVNQAQNLSIGNHVWVGWDCTILKNSNIPSGCIIGRSALVSGKFYEENCVLAGIPAKKIKSNIIWDRKTVNELLIDYKKQDK